MLLLYFFGKSLIFCISSDFGCHYLVKLSVKFSEQIQIIKKTQILNKLYPNIILWYYCILFLFGKSFVYLCCQYLGVGIFGFYFV